MRIVINKTSITGSFAKLKTKIVRQIIDELQVQQLEQVATAFRTGGQPGQPWKRLWADTFVGSVSRKILDKLGKAHARLMKMLRPNVFTPSSWARVIKAKGRVDELKEKATPATSYRKSGEPLRDNGQLAASFFGKSKEINGSKGTSIIASSAFYAVYQHAGLKTKGPNFIPLTLKARRMHTLGADPRKEGLEDGVDYIMAWKGVKVPARPIIDYSNPTNKELLKRAAIAGAKR